MSQLLPDSQSPDLHLDHPTPTECLQIWNNTVASWKDSLSVPDYLQESQFLTTVPLAKDDGMTTWILVDKNLTPNQRPILSSCESFRKRAILSDTGGQVRDTIVHGIASVFCPSRYRGRGYAARMMRELAEVLQTWQAEQGRYIGSILYSDIGKDYYSKLGWHPNGENSHIEFQPSHSISETQSLARPIFKEDLADLCQKDESMIRRAMAVPVEGIKTRMSVIPDLEHMLWHISKEEFACSNIFSKIPKVKGAIAGPVGSRIWAVWTHRYYTHPVNKEKESENTLYILRLVVEENATQGLEEGEDAEKANSLEAVIQTAQAEAAEWMLDKVKIWNPSPVVQQMIEDSGIEHLNVVREEESIASVLWYGENGEIPTTPLWINNEYYAWC